MLKIPFYKANIEQSDIDAVVEVLKTGWLTTGPRAQEFERDFGRYLGHQHAVAVNSCTAALHLALEAIGLRAGDGVLVPTMTFAASAEVVRYFDAQPLLVDCQEADFNLNVAHAEHVVKSALTTGRRVAAIIPVHYGGQICDVAGVRRLAGAYGLKIIEDAAHCCPAYYRDDTGAPWKSVGTGSDVSCYSFYANKTITTGEGGMACTNDKAIADRIRVMSLHGISKDAWKRFDAEGSWYYEIVAPGFKYNLTDVAAALGVVQLGKADRLHQRRSALASRYSEMLSDISEITVPSVHPNRVHSWHLYVIRLHLERLTITRTEFIERLRQAGIGCSVHWLPLHMHPYYRTTYGHRSEDYPVAARVYEQIISLPIYPDMTEPDVCFVADTIRTIVSQHLRPN